jgi:YidC/Oxa1 family membrane protein insertase
MNNEKRIVLFVVLLSVWMLVYSFISREMGWNPPPKKLQRVPPRAALAGDDKEVKPGLVKADDTKPEQGEQKPAVDKTKDQPGAPAKPGVAAAPAAGSRIEIVDPAELVMGATGANPDGYNIEVQLEQNGAGIESISSALFDAEFEEGKPGNRRLQLIRRDPTVPASLSLTVNAGAQGAGAAAPADPDDDEAARLRRAAADAEDPLASAWEVVRDQGKIVRTGTAIHPDTHTQSPCQEVVFRATARNGVVFTKTIRLFPHTDGVEVDLKLESPDQDRAVVYNILGPHGIPIEGEWYTSTFRDVVFAQLKGSKVETPVTHSAHDVASAGDNPPDNTALPLVYAGVENQYFALLIEPAPAPTGLDDRLDSKTTAIVLRKDSKALQKADVGVRITSRQVSVGPNRPVEHHYRVFTGPKTPKALKPYQAEALATYRKNWIPFAPWIAQNVITPTLRFTYEVTVWVSQRLGGTKGNYGIAIILLTILVRGLMFPIGRKQALAAQKMQQLQPHLKELQERFKDDKERLTKETFALYKQHGVNPVAGCLPALIQLPIFVGLWQALNTSFPLRHATFLWIRDLAAPDMMFHFPFEIWFLGNWFNLLPFLVVGLMLVQTKLFAPPATTPEAEMQQKMMKYMMIFMGFMFYKVPSGLGIYFITSSLWAIGERLLLPKVTHAHLSPSTGSDGSDRAEEKGTDRRGPNGSNGDGSKGGKTGPDGARMSAKPPGRIAQFFERVLEEARKDSTYRNLADERDGTQRDTDRDKDRPRPRPKPRKR